MENPPSIRGRVAANALGDRRLEAVAEVTAPVEADALYETLADVSGHLRWGSQRNGRGSGLITLDAPAGTARVGTEFSSTGIDPMGSFDDRSVVTEASPGRVFEFVTEARLIPKRGGEPIEWTVIHRYEIARHGTGSRLAYRFRIVGISRTPGILRLFRSRFAGLLMRMSASAARRGLADLIAVASERGERKEGGS